MHTITSYWWQVGLFGLACLLLFWALALRALILIPRAEKAVVRVMELAAPLIVAIAIMALSLFMLVYHLLT